MEEHAIPVAYLVFPILLPLGECELLKKTVSPDNKHWGCGFKPHTAFYADDGVTHMAVATDGIGCSDFLNGLYGFDFVVIVCAVYRA